MTEVRKADPSVRRQVLHYVLIGEDVGGHHALWLLYWQLFDAFGV
ncbi:hypothetical protein [Methylomicrobium sp. Wu6]|nr:hypothetical protein [Methylomicrobium sp. Wu6]MEC4748060.1 hypothetical protein [Methylomicrobium sp. Wu6]